MTRIQTIKEAILKRLGFFSLDQLIAETHLSERIVKKAIDQFEKDRVIIKCHRNSSDGYPGVYRINRAEEGEQIALNRMWKVIRYKGRFELSDLVKLANVNRETARSFIKALRKAGFIVPNKPTGRGVFWTLIKDPGPRRPYVGLRLREPLARRGIRQKDIRHQTSDFRCERRRQSWEDRFRN